MLDMAEYDQQVELTIRLSRKSVDEKQMRQTGSDRSYCESAKAIESRRAYCGHRIFTPI